MTFQKYPAHSYAVAGGDELKKNKQVCCMRKKHSSLEIKLHI